MKQVWIRCTNPFCRRLFHMYVPKHLEEHQLTKVRCSPCVANGEVYRYEQSKALMGKPNKKQSRITHKV